MQIIMAKNAGFCFGVRRAVETVERALEEGEKRDNPRPIYTYGQIIHNKCVVIELEERGVTVLDSIEELKNSAPGTVIIRAHGVPADIYGSALACGHRIIDATCPYVKRIHDIVEAASEKGREIIVIGSPNHPEVEGITSRARGQGCVICSIEEAERKADNQGYSGCIVAQTTFDVNKFQDIVDIFERKGYNGSVVNTICNATKERQEEAARIAARVDVMIVIGDTHSSNTAKLVDICTRECPKTLFVETLEDFPNKLPISTSKIGITAGASTPNKIIEEIENYVRTNF